MRLFVSVDIPDSLADAVRDVQATFADVDGLDVTDPAQAHVTLAFLGDVGDDEYDALVAAIARAVSDADVEPFEASLEGLGAFPSPGDVRVLWLGVGDGADELTTLHDAVTRETAALGYEADDDDFTPHITLARMRDTSGDALARLVAERHPVVGTARVSAVRLTESTLGADGPTYETRERFALDG